MSVKDKVLRGHYLFFIYYWLYEAYMDRKIGGIRINKMLGEIEAVNIFPVQSTSYRILDQLNEHIKVDENDVFVDVGCGWGRMISYMLIKGKICNLIGIEINKEAAEIANQRLKAYSNVMIMHGDILEYIPDKATVFFLSNPFSADILRQFIMKINKEIKHSVKLIYLHAVYQEVFSEFSEWCVELDTFLRPRYHIPIRLCIYSYKAAESIDT